MNKIGWIVATLIAGALLPIQAGLNSKVAKAGENPIYAAAISFVVGTMALLLIIFFTKQEVSWEGLKTAPLYVWVAGLMGAFYVTTILLVFPKLGPGLCFSLVIASQMIVSVVLEHFNILVANPQPINWIRFGGVLLVVLGVIIIKNY